MNKMEIEKKPKIRICKCGHARKDHKENPDKKLSLPGECKKCQCSHYMNRKLPSKLSKVMMFYGIGIISFIIVSMSIIVYHILPSWNKPVMVTAGSLITLTICIFLLVILQIFSVCIYGYYREKKRKTYPVEDGLK